MTHHHAVSRDDDKRLGAIRLYTAVQTRDEIVALRKSSRNTPALFGAGLIDGVPDAAILEAEKRRFAAFPEIKGRASRLPGGRLGRFGWKGQTARLNDFVLAACSNELGLEVPGRHQVSLASALEFDPAKLKLDLTAQETARLTTFVANLPTPVRPIRESTLPPWGYMVFERHWFATCHSRRLGRVNGLYSDLLLHDLGDRVFDFGGYGGSANPSGVKDLAEQTAPARTSGEAFRPNGARRHSGEWPIRLPICTTAGQARSTKPSASTAARRRRPPSATESSTAGIAASCSRFFSR